MAAPGQASGRSLAAPLTLSGGIVRDDDAAWNIGLLSSGKRDFSGQPAGHAAERGGVL